MCWAIFCSYKIWGECILVSKASQKGLLTDQMTSQLYNTVNEDYKARERKSRELDDVLFGKLHKTCEEEFNDSEEAICVLRRYLSLHYKVPLADVDQKLQQLGLLSTSATAMVMA